MSWTILFTLCQQIITHHTWFARLKHFYRPLNLLSSSVHPIHSRGVEVRPLNFGDWRFRHEDDSIASMRYQYTHTVLVFSRLEQRQRRQQQQLNWPMPWWLNQRKFNEATCQNSSSWHLVLVLGSRL